MPLPEDPLRLWTGSEDEPAVLPVRSRSVERVRASLEPDRVDIAGIRLRFAIAIALAVLGMLIVLAGIAVLS